MIGDALRALAALDYPADRWSLSTSSPTTAPTARSRSPRAAGVDVHENTVGQPGQGAGAAVAARRCSPTRRADTPDAVVVVDADTVVDRGFLGAARRPARGRRRASSRASTGSAIPASRRRRPASRGARAAPPPAAARADRARRLVRPVRQRHGVPRRRAARPRLERPPHRGHRAAERAAARRRARRLRAGRGRRGRDADDARGRPTQNERWERGRIELARRYVPRLLRRGPSRSPAVASAAVDGVLDHVVPPLSVLVAALRRPVVAVVSTVVAIVRRPHRPPGSGLVPRRARCPRRVGARAVDGAARPVYRSLLHAPAMVVWKVRLWARMLVRPGRRGLGPHRPRRGPTA